MNRLVSGLNKYEYLWIYKNNLYDNLPENMTGFLIGMMLYYTYILYKRRDIWQRKKYML